MTKFVHVCAGETIKILAKLIGRPIPQITWKINDRAVGFATDISTTADITQLQVENCHREHAGRYIYIHFFITHVSYFLIFSYSILASNSSGEKSTSVNVKVYDTPGKVENLRVKLCTSYHVVLTWDYPVYDGCSDVFNYVIEAREASRKAWRPVGSSDLRTTYKVTGLLEGSSYFFK